MSSYFTHEEMVNLARPWIRKYMRPATRINRRWTAYSLKHLVERWYLEAHGQFAYVTMEAFVDACRAEGIKDDAVTWNAPTQLQTRWQWTVLHHAYIKTRWHYSRVRDGNEPLPAEVRAALER